MSVPVDIIYFHDIIFLDKINLQCKIHGIHGNKAHAT